MLENPITKKKLERRVVNPMAKKLEKSAALAPISASHFSYLPAR